MTETKVPVRHTRMIKRIKISNDLDRELGEQAVQAASRRKLPPIDPEDEAAILLYASAGLTVENAVSRIRAEFAHVPGLRESFVA